MIGSPRHFENSPDDTNFWLIGWLGSLRIVANVRVKALLSQALEKNLVLGFQQSRHWGAGVSESLHARICEVPSTHLL
jgi:hypothetical protein